MKRVVFLLEEYSMKVFLDGLLPRAFPGLPFLCVPHEGKQDLEKSLPRKLRAWREPGVRFVVLRDNDGGDCKALKNKLLRSCKESGREDTVVRIPCQELESWYLGDTSALGNAYERANLERLGAKAAFRDPDSVQQPSARLGDLVPEFQKVSAARLLGARISIDANRSRSFRVFVESLRVIHSEFASPPASNPSRPEQPKDP